MNPSFLSVCAKDNLSPDAGISAKSCCAVRALRMRVSISAIGSVIIVPVLPTGFLDPRQVPQQGELTEADTAEAEGPQVGARGPAAGAPGAGPPLELLLLFLRFFFQ